MKTFQTAVVDQHKINVDLAKALGGPNAQIHVFKGRDQSYGVRMLNQEGAWKKISWNSPAIAKFVEKALECEVVQETDRFRVKVPGVRVNVLADDRRLGLALAAIKRANPVGFKMAYH